MHVASFKEEPQKACTSRPHQASRPQGLMRSAAQAPDSSSAAEQQKTTEGRRRQVRTMGHCYQHEHAGAVSSAQPPQHGLDFLQPAARAMEGPCQQQQQAAAASVSSQPQHGPVAPQLTSPAAQTEHTGGGLPNLGPPKPAEPGSSTKAAHHLQPSQPADERAEGGANNSVLYEMKSLDEHIRETCAKKPCQRRQATAAGRDKRPCSTDEVNGPTPRFAIKAVSLKIVAKSIAFSTPGVYDGYMSRQVRTKHRIYIQQCIASEGCGWGGVACTKHGRMGLEDVADAIYVIMCGS